MPELSEHQERALKAYEALMASQPALFGRRPARPIVRELDQLAAYAAEYDTVLGVAAETPYVLFIVDLVESRSPGGDVKRHPYLRVVSRPQLEGGVNLVVLATIEDSSLGNKGDIVMVEQERHALGTTELELPRGFGEPKLSGESNALRELEEETGYSGDHAHLLGVMSADSGLTDTLLSFYHVPVTRHLESNPEMGEAISGVRLLRREDLWQSIQSGGIRDGFTLQALALYENLRTARST